MKRNRQRHPGTASTLSRGRVTLLPVSYTQQVFTYILYDLHTLYIPTQSKEYTVGHKQTGNIKERKIKTLVLTAE